MYKKICIHCIKLMISLKRSISLNSYLKNSQIFKPKKETVWLPYGTVLIFFVECIDLILVTYGVLTLENAFHNFSRKSLYYIYILVSKVWEFLSCLVTELSQIRSSLEDANLSLKSSLSAHAVISCSDTKLQHGWAIRK